MLKGLRWEVKGRFRGPQVVVTNFFVVSACQWPMLYEVNPYSQASSDLFPLTSRAVSYPRKHKHFEKIVKAGN